MDKHTVGFEFLVADTGYRFQRQQTRAIDVVLQRLAQQTIDTHDVNKMKTVLEMQKARTSLM